MSSAKRMLRSIVAVGEGCGESVRFSCLWERLGQEPISVRTPSEASDVLRQRGAVDLVLVLADDHGSEAHSVVRSVSRLRRDVPVVVLSGDPSIAQAVQFIRVGAFDYLPIPIDEDATDRLMRQLAARGVSGAAGSRFFCEDCPAGVEIVGRSPGMVRCLKTLRLLSESGCDPVLILGRTGVGKELAARAVHWWRHGDFERFVAVNCATLSPNLLESELFGHVKGAFTGADKDKAGLFEQAAGGSIFLDEITEMAPSLQAKLLRVIQEKAFRRVGGTQEIPCRADLIASSNRAPAEAVRERRLREDLYYRMAVFPITVPPLRDADRREDILLLAEYFLTSSDIPARTGPLRIGQQAAQRLMQHDWPGNARELKNVIARAIVLAKGPEIGPESLIFDHEAAAMAPPAPGLAALPLRGNEFSLVAAERELIVRALEQAGGRRTQAAALLGITRTTLHAKLKRYKINSPSVPGRPASSASGAGRDRARPAGPEQ